MYTDFKPGTKVEVSTTLAEDCGLQTGVVTGVFVYPNMQKDYSVALSNGNLRWIYEGRLTELV